LPTRFLEDFTVGQRFASGEEHEITPERLAAYATEFDPQGIHLDPAIAAREMFGGIIASGWHSLSATMRLIVRSEILGGDPLVGVGVDRLRYLEPVRAGDRLHAEAEVVEVRPSRSNAERGYLVLRVTTLRHDDLPVLTQEWTLLVPRRTPAADAAG
jgi:acyl dehydratase